MLGLGAEGVNTVSAVKSHSDLLVCVDEALQLGVQLDILAGEHVAVVLESVHLGTHIRIVALH